MSDGSAVAPALAPAPHLSTFILDPIMPEGEIHLITGPSNVGKTPFILQFLDCLRQGLPFLEYPTTPLPFIYISFNQTGEAIRRALIKLHIEPVSFPHFSVKSQTSIPLEIEAIIIHAIATVPGLRLIVFDGVTRLVPRRMTNDYATIADLTDEMGRQRAKHHLSHPLTFLCAGASSKMREGEGYSDPRSRMTGSNAWSEHTDLNINIDRAAGASRPNDPRRTVTVMPRGAAPQVLDWCFGDDGILVNTSEGLQQSLMEQWLARHTMQPEFTTSELTTAAEFNGVSRSWLFEWLKRSDCALERVRHGAYRSRFAVAQ